MTPLQRLETQALVQLRERRERGVLLRDLAWKYRTRWIVLTALCGLGVWLFGRADSPMAVGAVAGLGLGAILGDLRHLRVAARLWPLHSKIIDWNRVEQLLGDRSSERDDC